MKVYTLEGSLWPYSDNTTWIEGVFAASGDASIWVAARPLAGFDPEQSIDTIQRNRQFIREWEEITAQSIFACRRAWRAETRDPNDWEAIEWTVVEWEVGEPQGRKPIRRPCGTCGRNLITSPDPDVVYCGRRDCAPAATEAAITQPLLRRPRERKLQ